MGRCPRRVVATALMLFAASHASLMAVSLPGVSWSSVYEFTSGSFSDESGNGNTLSSFTGSPGFVPDRSGSSSSAFQGSTGRILGKSGALAGFNPASNQLTLSAWIKTSSTGNELIVSMGRSSSSFEGEWIWGISSGKLYFWDYQGGNGFPATFTSTASVNNGQWRHVAFVRNGLTGTFYVDGIPAGSMTAAKNVSYANSVLALGGDYRDNNGFWTGSLDDLSISSTALTAAQVLLLSADASVPGVETGPTNSISGLTQTSVKLMGGITNLGGTTVTNAGFYLNTNSTATNGVKYSAPGTSFGLGSFSNTITGLTPGTSYYYRAFAANSVGTGYGTNEYSFTTPSPSPFTYTTSTTGVTITGYTGTGGAVEIPATIGGLPVTEIGNYAFQSKSNLTAVIVPSGVTTIGANAFADCANLASVTLPSSVTLIRSGAFFLCPQLTTISIPSAVNTIEYNAFLNCSTLAVVNFEGSHPPMSIEVSAFLGLANGAVGYYPATASAAWQGVTIAGLTLTPFGQVNRAPVILSRFAVGFNEDGTSTTGWTGVGANDSYGPDKPSFSNGVLVATATGSSSLGSTPLMAGTYTVQFAHGLPFANGAPGTLTVSAEAVANGSSTTLYTLGTSSALTLRTDTIWMTDSFTFTIPNGDPAIGKYLKLTFNHSAENVWHGIDSVSVFISGSSTFGIPALIEDVTGNLLFSSTPFSDVDSSSLTVTLSVDAGAITGNAGTGITVGGTATVRTFAGTLADLNAYFITAGKITYLAPQDFNGSKTLGILVSDGQLTATGSATINVQPSNDVPVLAEILSSYSGGFNQPQMIPLAASDVETPVGDLLFTASSNNQSLFPNGNLEIHGVISSVIGGSLGSTTSGGGISPIGNTLGGGSEMSWELVATPATGQSGEADITVTVTDGGGALASRTFHITVLDAYTTWAIANEVGGVNPSDDSDGDGATNQQEFAAGTNPNDPNSLPEHFVFDANTGTITGYSGPSGEVVIPGVIGGVAVTKIGDNAFQNMLNLTGVVIPESVASIGSNAFFFCTSLASITIPDSVLVIGENAFWNCHALKSATIGSGVTALPRNAFSECWELTSVSLGANVKTLGDYAFNNCGKLKSITFPSGFESMGAYAFALCADLTSITLPESVSSIGFRAFRLCTKLSTIHFEGNTPPTIEGEVFSGIATGATGYYPATAGANWSGVSYSGITIRSNDQTAPVITLIGANPIEIYEGGSFSDPGATVADNVDTTRTIKGSGTVNTATVGNYTLTYNTTDAAGNLAASVTRTVVVKSIPATISLSAESGSYTLLQGAVPLDDRLTVSGGETFSGATIQIETGFAAGDMLNLTPSIGGITGIYDGTKGILTLSGSGSASEYQSALRAVTFSTTSTSTVARGFKVTLGSAISFGGHFYEYVPGSHSWAGARTLALSKTFNGLSGYLANLTSADENSFVKTKIGTDVWIGGSDEGTEGVWKWMDGPEAGITFWNGLSTGSAPSGRYANWNSGEPNDAGNEDYAQFYVATGKWNDLPSGSRLGFLVEYGTDNPANQTFSGTRIFSVTKATPTIIAAPTAAPISYGQTLGSSTLSGGSASVSGRFAWADSAASPSAGTANLEVTFTPKDTANYNTVTTSVSVTVNKATPTITALPGFMSATGGTISGSGDFIIHTFRNVGSYTFQPMGSGTVEILVVAGGGGAGYDGGGGGGAGGVITNTVSVASGTEYTVVVGGGGAAAPGPQWGANGSSGGNSQFGSFTAIGGAGGYNGHAEITAITTGGSGGGEGFAGGGPGNGTPGQGNRGGYKSMDSAGGGGGGAGEVGGNASSGRGGNGGIGVQSDISGVATWYGGGGAGGSWEGIGGNGGMGGGGNGGGRNATAGANGVANTGGGGGGNGYASSSDSGMGGSGIVIVRYKPKILTYGQSIGEATFSGATASVPGSFAFANPLATPAAGNNSLSVIFTPTDTANYETVTTSVSLRVTKATPTIALTPTPTPISYGQTLAFSTLSGGVASVQGSFAWADSAATPATGTTIQNVIFTPEDRANYNEVTIPVNVTVNQALISSGFSHTLYLGAGDSTVTAWGLNTDGRLGVGDMNSPVNWAKVVQGIPTGATVDGLAAGGTHSLILAGGKVYAAGSDRYGQLGQGAVNGATKTSFTPVEMPSSISVAIAAGGNHSLVVTADGKVFACGDNFYGQLAQPATTASSGTLVEVNFPGLSTKIVSVAAGADHNLAVDENGGVWVWGRNNYGQLGKGTRTAAERTPSKLAGMTARSVAAGFSHSLILETSGTGRGFGRNNCGQTGQSTTSSMVLVPTLISGLSGIRSIAAGTDSSFAIDQAGQLRSWGYNAYGELLLGYASPSSSPSLYVPTPSPIATNVFNVAGGGYSTLAVGAQGVIFGGRNDVGQAGNGPDPEQVVGDYYNDAGSLTLNNLTMDLAGTTETLYDQIFVGNGAVTLNGILNLMFVGTYTGPVYGSTQTFDLIWAQNGIVLGTGYQIAFNQSGYLAETERVAKDGGEVLRATVRAVVTTADLAKAVDLARPSLDGVESVSYRGGISMGISTFSVSAGVEMIYSYERPTGGVTSGAQYFVNGITYRVEQVSSLTGVWGDASVSGTTVTPLGNGGERVTLRISSSGGAGFLRLQVENPLATGINAGVGSAVTY